MAKKPPPSNSDVLRFSKREQTDRKGSAATGDLAFSKREQMGAATGSTRPPAPPRERQTGTGASAAADLPFSKQRQMGKEPGSSRPHKVSPGPRR